MKLVRPFSPSIALFSVAASLGVATVISSAAPASAISGPVTLGYTCAATSPAAAVGCPVGISQFSTVVSPVVSPTGVTRALFSFTNTGSSISSITNIDIFAKPQFSLASIYSTSGSGSGVNFFTGTVSQSQFFSFSIGPGSTGVANGINPGESLNVVFDIVPGFNKPFNAVATSLFKKGITVQLQGAGFSYPAGVDPVTRLTFYSKVKAVPEPITMLGSAAALGFGALMKRRSSQLKAQKGGNKPVLATCETLV
jgi:hypothetical protein